MRGLDQPRQRYKVALHSCYEFSKFVTSPFCNKHSAYQIQVVTNIQTYIFIHCKKCKRKIRLIINALQIQKGSLQKYKLFGRNYITPTLLIKVSFY